MLVIRLGCNWSKIWSLPPRNNTSLASRYIDKIVRLLVLSALSLAPVFYRSQPINLQAQGRYHVQYLCVANTEGRRRRRDGPASIVMTSCSNISLSGHYPGYYLSGSIILEWNDRSAVEILGIAPVPVSTSTSHCRCIWVWLLNPISSLRKTHQQNSFGSLQQSIKIMTEIYREFMTHGSSLIREY